MALREEVVAGFGGRRARLKVLDAVEVTPAPDPALPWASRVILRSEVGSTAHGTGLPGGEDYDEMGVVWERWESAVGLDDDPDNIVFRPGRAHTERSEPGDYDLVLYTPRKFARLAASGNPSVLMLLFGPLRFSTPLGDQLRALAPAFWSDRARERFLGYSRAQRERLLGIRGGAHTNRPELVEQFGYDTKYAMHMLRLGIQGIEYATTGKLTLPIPNPHGDVLRNVRLGNHTRDEVLAMADANEATLETLTSTPPPAPDVAAINQWLLDCHRSQLPAAQPSRWAMRRAAHPTDATSANSTAPSGIGWSTSPGPGGPGRGTPRLPDANIGL